MSKIGDRLAIATDFARQQREQYPEISTVFVVGSIARGDAVESSDIDIKLLSRDTSSLPDRPDPSGCWRGAIFIDASYVDAEEYTDSSTLLSDPYLAGSVREAVVLHDADGWFSEVQRTVVDQFMEPKWLKARLTSLAVIIERNLTKATAALEAGDKATLCQASSFVLWSTSEFLLVREGVSPKWVRALQMLGEILPAERDVLLDLEGGTSMQRQDVARLAGFHVEALNPGPGTLRHVQHELDWMINNGLHREALHGLWVSVGLGVRSRLDPDDDGVRSDASDLAQRWFHNTGWNDDQLSDKVAQLHDHVRGRLRWIDDAATS